jgi:tetratricopeptide (TPR) repeat protein
MKTSVLGIAALAALAFLGGCATQDILPSACVNPQYWGETGEVACTAEIDRGRHSDDVRADMYTNRGAYRIRMQQYDLAVEDLTSAIRLKPGDVNARINRAIAYHHLNKLAEAMADLQEAQSLEPQNDAVYSNRALIEMEQRDFRAAADDFARTEAITPNPQWEVRLAYSFEKVGRYQEAVVAYSNAIAKGGPWLYWRAWRANAYREAGLKDLARADDVAVASLPDSPWWFVRSMRCYARAREKINFDGALNDCDLAQADPQHDESWTREIRAFLFMQFGRYGDAISDWSAALEARPDWPTALYGRGMARKMAGDVKGGEADIAAALAKASDAEDDYNRILAIGGSTYRDFVVR